MARVSQAALVTIGPLGREPEALVFDLNPHRVLRRIERGPGRRLTERIFLRVPFDATVALEHPEANPAAAQHGVRPQLSALQTMQKQDAPLLLVWGERTVAVRIDALDIREDLFDSHLNPLRATARIDLSVTNEAPSWMNPWHVKVQRADAEQTADLAKLAFVPAQVGGR